jgi:hypothetical protein
MLVLDPDMNASTLTPSRSNKTPGGYCGLGGTGVSCPVGLTS